MDIMSKISENKINQIEKKEKTIKWRINWTQREKNETK